MISFISWIFYLYFSYLLYKYFTFFCLLILYLPTPYLFMNIFLFTGYIVIYLMLPFAWPPFWQQLCRASHKCRAYPCQIRILSCIWQPSASRHPFFLDLASPFEHWTAFCKVHELLRVLAYTSEMVGSLLSYWRNEIIPIGTLSKKLYVRQTQRNVFLRK